MAPFEALYGRKCRTPLNWVELGERRFYGIDFVDEAEKKGPYYSTKHASCTITSGELYR
jgi:hypothetical protein